MNIYASFCYNGEPFQLAYQDTIAFIAGRVLYLWDLEKNTKQYIKTKGYGFQSFSCNAYKKMIVLADYGQNPDIYFYKYGSPEPELLATNKEIAELEIISMDISLDGKYLLVVSGVPNYQITIFDISDLKNIKKLEGNQSTRTLGHGFISAKFSPQKETLFSVLYEKELQLCEIHPSYENLEGQEEVERYIRISSQNLPAPPDGKFLALLWDEQNNIYLSTQGVSNCMNQYMVRYLSGEELSDLHESYESKYPIQFFVLTQKHIILVSEQGYFDWLYKYEPSFLKDEEFTPFKLNKEFRYQCDKDDAIITIMYNHTYKRLFAGTKNGEIIVLPEEAESLLGEDEEEQNDQYQEGSDEEDKTNEIQIDFYKHGPYHTGSVIFIRELQKYNIVMTISSKGQLFLWDIKEKKCIFTRQIESHLSSAYICPQDKQLMIGSSSGVLRILDVSDLQKIQIIQHIRLYKDKPIDFIEINNQKGKEIMAIGSKQSKKIFFINCQIDGGTHQKPYRIIGYQKLQQKLFCLSWNTKSENLLFALHQNFIISIAPPEPDHYSKDPKQNGLSLTMLHKRIQSNIFHIVSNPKSDELVVTGEDIDFKTYTFPKTIEYAPDTRAQPPERGNLNGHPLPTMLMKVCPNKKFLLSGGQDGSIFLRQLDSLSQYREIQAHNLKFNGVSALEYSNKYDLCYSGGYDGSFFIWNSQNIQFQELDVIPDNILNDQPLKDKDDEDIPFYQDVLEQEYIRQQKALGEGQKDEILRELENIQQELQVLLRNNEEADEIEQLSRDDFCIDLASKDQILEKGKQSCEELRVKAQRENYRQEIYRNRLLKKTWDTMQTHLKSINGLETDLIVSNYHIRNREESEVKKLKWVKDMRRVELKERANRKENGIPEILEIQEFIKNPNEYFVNGLAGKPKLVLQDYEAMEEAKAQEQVQTHKPAGAQQGLQKQGGLGMGRPGGQNKKKEEAAKKAQEEREAEEKKKKQQEEEKARQEQEKNDGTGELSDWNYLYGALELFTNNRKRNQIVLLNNAIFLIKEEFNKEFTSCLNFRNTIIDNIQDKNKKIEEIMIDLQRDPNPYEPRPNVLENPEKTYLEVDGAKEIKFPKFKTREERRKEEELKKLEEERLAALMADDAGRRAVKEMMDGTLEEKKENLFDDKLVREDWMDKPEEELTDDQRIKLKEFEVKWQKQEEDKEKMRKNLESQYKKLNQEIQELCQKFDQRLLILFRRKLEYDYRIYEQELYIIKLSLSIIQEKEYSIKEQEYQDKRFQLLAKQNLIVETQKKLEELLTESGKNQQNCKQTYDAQLKGGRAGEDRNLKVIWNQVFGEQKDAQKKKTIRRQNFK